MTALSIVEHFDVFEDIGPGEVARAVDTFLDPLLLCDLKKDSMTALSEQLPLLATCGEPVAPSVLAGPRGHDWQTIGSAARLGITLRVVPAQSDISGPVANELAAGPEVSNYDLAWIKGGNFYKLGELGVLYGPFTQLLAHDTLVDWANPHIARDFQQEVAGMEAPWVVVQLLLIYDIARVAAPSADPAALAAWIQAHPGRFTFGTGFTGLSLLKSLMVGLAGDRAALAGEFDESRYHAACERLFTWLTAVRGALRREGRRFPRDVAQLHALFANGEVDFSMSMNDSEVDNNVANGLFPASACAYALRNGSIAIGNYLGVLARSPHRAAALVVVNELLSPAAQYEKQKPAVWGDGTVLDVARLPPPWPARFAKLPGRERAPPRAALPPLHWPSRMRD